MRDAGCVQRTDGVGDAFGAAIRDVISRKRNRMEAGPAHGGHVVGVRTRRGDIAAEARCMPRMRDFHVTDRNIGVAHARGDPVQPVVGLRNVEDEVTREQEVDVVHEAQIGS